MPLPGNITLVEVRADYVGFDGLPVTGEVRFTPTASRAADNAALTTLIGRTITGTLTTTVVVTVDEETDETYNYSVGRLSVTLPATDDTELVPFEFTYQVTEDFEGGADGYFIAVPVASADDGVDLTLVADIGPSGGIGNQVLVPGPAGADGADAPDASTTVKGLVELATSAETTTGTDTVRAVTPAGLKAVIGGDTGLVVVESNGLTLTFQRTGPMVTFDATGNMDSGTMPAGIIPTWARPAADKRFIYLDAGGDGTVTTGYLRANGDIDTWDGSAMDVVVNPIHYRAGNATFPTAPFS